MPFSSVWSDAGGTAMIGGRALALAATAGVIGACVLRFAVVRPVAARGAITGNVDRVAAGAGLAAALVLALAVPWRIVAQAELFASPGDALMPLVSSVLGTAWGRAASVQGVAAIVAAVGFAGARAVRAWGWNVAAPAAVVVAAVPAWMGHAAATEGWPAIAIGTDIVHMAAAGGWAGGVVVLAVVTRSLRVQADGGVLAAALIARFRTPALASATALLATGVVASLLRFHSPADVWRTPYGLVLVAKLVIIAAAAAMGWRHSRTAAARAKAAGAGAVTGSIAAEALLFIAVLAVTALLAGSPLP